MKTYDWGGKLILIGIIFILFFINCFNISLKGQLDNAVIGIFAALTITCFICIVTGIIRIIWNEGINKRKG